MKKILLSLIVVSLLLSTTVITISASEAVGEVIGGTATLHSYVMNDNDPPNIPDRPTGPASGKPGYNYQYTTVTTDPDDDDVYYGWNWTGEIPGEELTVDEWIGPYSSGYTGWYITHSWDEEGTYEIRVKAKDVYENESDWSDPLTVIMDYDIPALPTGSTNVKRFETCCYTTVAGDPNGGYWLYYQWDWGEYEGPWYLFPRPCGQEFVIRPHTWLTVGTHKVKVRTAHDKYDPSTYSNWSESLTVTVDSWLGGGGSSGSSCFLADTQITMADDSYKNIEDIEVGDLVKSYDITTGSLISAPVTKVYHHTPEEMTDYYLVINDQIRVTPNHLLYINGVLMPAGDAQVGDFLFSSGDLHIPINSIQQASTQVPTYNFEVSFSGEISGMYIAEGIGAYPLKSGASQSGSFVQQSMSSFSTQSSQTSSSQQIFGQLQ